MTYEDVGYDSSLLRSIQSTITSQTIGYSDVSGSQIQGDSITSLNGYMTVDLQNDRFYVNDGIIKRVELGVLVDGGIGLIIRDSQGNILMQISEGLNIIQSPSKRFQIKIDNEHILINDEGGTPIGVFGLV